MTTPKPLFSNSNTVATTTPVAVQTVNTPSLFSTLQDKPFVPVVNQNLSPIASKLVADFDLTKVEPQNLILFGVEKEKELAQQLDGLLASITKESSPVLFEMFNKLKKGVKDVNLPELKSEIENAQKQPFFSKLFGQTVGKHLQKAQERINGMLTAKSTALLDLVKKMEAETETASRDLLKASNDLKTLAQGYRNNVISLEDYEKAGEILIQNAEAYLAQMGEGEQKELFKQKVDLFRNRCMVINNSLANGPTQLKAIRLAEGSGLATLSELIMGSTSEFNQIKTALIKISVAHKEQGLQSLNEERRKMRSDLSVYADQLLEETAVKSAGQSSLNRLQDAEEILASATRLNSLSDKVAAEKAAGEQRTKEAAAKLLEVKRMMR